MFTALMAGLKRVYRFDGWMESVYRYDMAWRGVHRFNGGIDRGVRI